MNPTDSDNQFPVFPLDATISLVGRPPMEALVMVPVDDAQSDDRATADANVVPPAETMFLLPSASAVGIYLRCDGSRSVATLLDDVVRASTNGNGQAEPARAAMRAFLAQLTDLGLIEWLDTSLSEPRRILDDAAGTMPDLPGSFVDPVVHPFEIDSDISSALVLSATFTGGINNTNGALPCGQTGGLNNTAAAGPCSSGRGNLNIFGNRACGGGGFLNLFGGPGCGGA